MEEPEPQLNPRARTGTGSEKASSTDAVPRFWPSPADPLVFFFAVLSAGGLLLGFLRGEGSTSPIHGDFFFYHLPAILLFHTEPWRVAVRDYSSATMPLFHMAASLDPLLPAIGLLRWANFGLAAGTWLLFVRLLSLRFIPAAAGLRWWWLAGGLLAFSPYFRDQAFWPSTDNAAFFFVVLSLFLLERCRANARAAPHTANGRAKLHGLAMGAVVASACAVYTRQTDVFVAFYVALVLIIEVKPARGWVLAFLPLALPALYLCRLWHGLVPPSFQKRHEAAPSAGGLLVICAMVLYSVVPLLIAWLGGEHSPLRAAEPRHRKRLFGTVAVCAIFVAIFYTRSEEPFRFSGGMYQNILLRCGSLGRVGSLLATFAGGLVLTGFLRRSSPKPRWLALLFVAPLFTLRVFFQRYFDPMVPALFFAAADRSLVGKFATRRVLLTIAAVQIVLLAVQWISDSGLHRH